MTHGLDADAKNKKKNMRNPSGIKKNTKKVFPCLHLILEQQLAKN